MGEFIGIDLGTTFSAIARINEFGRPEIIDNADGKKLTPSVVAVDESPIVVGEQAKSLQAAGMASVASFFKREMGNPRYEHAGASRMYGAVELSAEVLKKLKRDAEATLGGPIADALISVPAYFGQAQRQATVEAGERAGLKVSGIVDEPAAAAMAFGLNRKQSDGIFLVYDLGGGTFDIALLEISGNDIKIVATAGDHELGGKDWDDIVARFAASEFEAEHRENPLEDSLNLNRMLVAAETAKKDLSGRTKTRIAVAHRGNQGSYELSREHFENLGQGLLERTVSLCESTLQRAGVSWKKLAGVILVGGSTRMPMVRNFIGERTGRLPSTEVNPDESEASRSQAEPGLPARKLNRGRRAGLPGAAARFPDIPAPARRPGGEVPGSAGSHPPRPGRRGPRRTRLPAGRVREDPGDAGGLPRQSAQQEG